MSALIDQVHAAICNENCICRTPTPLASVIRGQEEESELADNGWHGLWCLECGETAPPVQGTIEEAAAKFQAAGWAVESLERNQAICSPCANREDPSDYSAQYRSDAGGIL